MEDLCNLYTSKFPYLKRSQWRLTQPGREINQITWIRDTHSIGLQLRSAHYAKPKPETSATRNTMEHPVSKWFKSPEAQRNRSERKRLARCASFALASCTHESWQIKMARCGYDGYDGYGISVISKDGDSPGDHFDILFVAEMLISPRDLEDFGELPSWGLGACADDGVVRNQIYVSEIAPGLGLVMMVMCHSHSMPKIAKVMGSGHRSERKGATRCVLMHAYHLSAAETSPESQCLSKDSERRNSVQKFHIKRCQK